MFAETARLEIRKWTLDDFEAFAALIANEKVMQFSVMGCLNREEAWEYFQKKFLDEFKIFGFGRWALVCKEEQKIIGLAGLTVQEIDGEKKIELGYRLLPSYWGQGLAFEAADMICTYAFKILKLKELFSIIEPANTRSIRLAERLGMHLLKKTKYEHLDVNIYARFSC